MSFPFQAEPVTVDLSSDKELNRTYTTVYQIISPPEYGPRLALLASNVPNILSYWQFYDDFDPEAYFDGFSVGMKEELEGGYIKWTLNFKHSTQGKGEENRRDPAIPRGNPIYEPPQISGSFQSYQVIAHRDKDGVPLLNAAKGRYNPPIMKDEGYDTLNFSKNTPFINLLQRAQALNKVNSTEMWGLGIRQVKLKSWRWSVVWTPTFPYVKNDLEWHINYTEHPTTNCQSITAPIGWYDTRPNIGFTKLDGSGNPEVIEIKGKRPTEPQYLACNGTLVAPGGDETWNVHAVEKEFDFLSLGFIPNPLPGPFLVSE